MCPACGLLASTDVAHHITKRQIETIALERGRRTDGGDAGAHSEWVERNFDNQTVVAVYFGDACGCAPQYEPLGRVLTHL
jgi:hypothetical protein